MFTTLFVDLGARGGSGDKKLFLEKAMRKRFRRTVGGRTYV